MLTKNKKLTYAVILTFLVILFIATGERALLREMLVAQEIYYRGEYLITTYYPAPYAQYQDLIAMANVGIGTTELGAGKGKLIVADDGSATNNDGRATLKITNTNPGPPGSKSARLLFSGGYGGNPVAPGHMFEISTDYFNNGGQD